MILLNIFLELKSKHIIKGAIAHIEKKQGKFLDESISPEIPSIKKTTKLNQNKTSPVKQAFFCITQTLVGNTLLVINCKFTVGSVICLV